MSIRGVNFQGFYEGLVKAQGRVNNIGNVKAEKYRDVVRMTLRMLAEASPQWSGFYASNWRVTYSTVRAGGGGAYLDAAAAGAQDRFKEDSPWGGSFVADNVKERGSPEAVNFAVRINEPLIAKIPSAFSRVDFRNITPYATQIARNRLSSADALPHQQDKIGKPFLRPVNVVDPSPIPVGYVKERLRTMNLKDMLK